MIKDVPILKLQDDTIRSLFLDKETYALLVGTTSGNILKVEKITNNIYGTGKRDISAVMEDGFGNKSDIFHQIMTYALAKQLIRVTPDDTPEILTSQMDAYAALQVDEIRGSFISPALWAGHDFGYWEKFLLNQSCPSGCETEFFIRTGNSVDELYRNDWISIYHGVEAAEEIPIGAAGGYIQIKVSMKTAQKGFRPLVYKVMASYRTKHAVYFFTNKFVLKKNTNAKYGLFTATYSLRNATEIQFGISDKSSANWDDYEPIQVNKLAAIPSNMKDRFKIGIKLISHALDAAPVVDDFVFFFDGEKKNMLYEGGS